MKKYILILALSLFPLISFANDPDFARVRKEIETQAANPESTLNTKIKNLITVNKLPAGTRLQLAGIDLLQKGNEQVHHECIDGECRYYERKFYRQISDVRWMSQDRTQLKAWVIGIYCSVLKVWKSNPAQDKLEPVKDEATVDTVIFL